MGLSHHGDDYGNAPESDVIKRLMDQFHGTAKREYPRGRMGAEDDGALSYAVAADKAHGTVVIRFGKPVEWIGLGVDDCKKLIECLIQRAREITTKPFSIEV
jgi:hypothetical protein